MNEQEAKNTQPLKGRCKKMGDTTTKQCKLCNQEYKDALEHVRTVAHPQVKMNDWRDGQCPICGTSIYWLALGSPQAPIMEASCPQCGIVYFED